VHAASSLGRPMGTASVAVGANRHMESFDLAVELRRSNPDLAMFHRVAIEELFEKREGFSP
jgi:hypothetical protein